MNFGLFLMLYSICYIHIFLSLCLNSLFRYVSCVLIFEIIEIGCLLSSNMEIIEKEDKGVSPNTQATEQSSYFGHKITVCGPIEVIQVAMEPKTKDHNFIKELISNFIILKGTRWCIYNIWLCTIQKCQNMKWRRFS